VERGHAPEVLRLKPCRRGGLLYSRL
jgi:hypothetical protein